MYIFFFLNSPCSYITSNCLPSAFSIRSGKDRNLNIVELLCATCNRWFHESCIGFQLGRLIPFATNYIFICKNCSPTGLESFRKSQASIPQMCITAIANMQQSATKEGKSKCLFSKDHEIIPYIEQYWEAMTTMPRRVTQSWCEDIALILPAMNYSGCLFFYSLQVRYGSTCACKGYPHDFLVRGNCGAGSNVRTIVR